MIIEFEQSSISAVWDIMILFITEGEGMSALIAINASLRQTTSSIDITRLAIIQ